MSPKSDYGDDWENEAKGKSKSKMAKYLPDAPLKVILKSGGTPGGQKAANAGEDAVMAFRKAVEAYAFKLAGLAMKMANQDHQRKTIKEDDTHHDIKLALEMMKMK